MKKEKDDLNAESNDESGSSYHPSDSSSCLVTNGKKDVKIKPEFVNTILMY